MKKTIWLFLLFPMQFLLMSAAAFSQTPVDTTTATETRLTLSYLCSAGDSVSLTATLFVRRNGEIMGLKNAVIGFTVSGEGEPQNLGTSMTDQEGNAVMKVALRGLPANKEGIITYEASFLGGKKYLPANATFSAKPVKIALQFNLDDSVRMIILTGTQLDAKGETVAVPKTTVSLYVPRLFSLLKIGEVELDDAGTASFEFTKRVVGDTLGNLTILARIEEHDIFGFAQTGKVVNWGIHKQYFKAETPSRELWTPIAPMWMIITLIVMLTGVWAHYFYAVYELYMINRSSKKGSR